MTEPNTPVEIGYATPAPRSPARTFAATMIVAGGLALILLGGCFLIGVLVIIKGQAAQQIPLTAGEIVFAGFLVLLALAAFAGAVLLLVIGIRALLHVIRM
jgi:heme/copper-type cytochrome/quinol oxidase subunit 1